MKSGFKPLLLQPLCSVLLCALVLVGTPAVSNAQGYPTKAIKFVAGYPPGGSTDSAARIVGQKLSERLGQPVVVENKPGADSSIATEYVAKAAADGYTLLLGGSGQMVFNPGLYAHLPYDTVKDFIPITLFVESPLVFAVHPSHPAKSINDLIALARAKPGETFYASGASQFYVAMEVFKKEAGVDIVHVPYKGSGPAVTAAMAGEVPLVITSVASALTQLRGGKLRALAVTGAKRDPLLPDVPTVAESGLDVEGGIWVGLFAPAATPRPVIDRLARELTVILKSESLQAQLISQGYATQGMGMTPPEFDAFFKAGLGKWSKAMKGLNIKLGTL